MTDTYFEIKQRLEDKLPYHIVINPGKYPKKGEPGRDGNIFVSGPPDPRRSDIETISEFEKFVALYDIQMENDANKTPILEVTSGVSLDKIPRIELRPYDNHSSVEGLKLRGEGLILQQSGSNFLILRSDNLTYNIEFHRDDRIFYA